MLAIVKEYNTLEAAEIGQNNILAWLININPLINSTRWADVIEQDGKFYVPLDSRVMECPEANGFIEIEIIQNDGF